MNIELTKETALEILVRCINIAQLKGAFSIKDGAFLYRIIKKDEEKDYDALTRAVIIANGKGCYTLEEAAIIDDVVTFLEKEKSSTK
jgi:hypothetical protein